MFWISTMLSLLRELVSTNKSILKVLRMRSPGLIFLRVTDKFKKGTKTMLRFKLLLPAPGASDVVARKLVVVNGNNEPQQLDLPGDSLETLEMEGQDNDVVSGTLEDIDDADNVSPAREFSFVLTDTIAPPQPGEIGLVVTGE